MAPASTVLSQSAIAEGDELFLEILQHPQRLYPEVYGYAVSLSRAPSVRNHHLGEDGEGLSGGDIIINSFSKLGACAGSFNNIIPSTARMNNPSPILTNAYLDTLPVGPAPYPLEYYPISG